MFYDDFTSSFCADRTALTRRGDSSNGGVLLAQNVAIVIGVLQLTRNVDSSCEAYNYSSGDGAVDIVQLPQRRPRPCPPAIFARISTSHRFLGHNCEATNIASASNYSPVRTATAQIG